MPPPPSTSFFHHFSSSFFFPANTHPNTRARVLGGAQVVCSLAILRAA
jgi:hypothetical protein